MAPKTLLDAESVPGVDPQQVAELLDLLRLRLTFNGVRVLRLRVELEDGTEQRLQWPTSKQSKDWTRTKPGRAILDVLAREQRSLKGDTIARLADYSYTGSFRSALSGLVKQGEIVHDPEDDGYELA